MEHNRRAFPIFARFAAVACALAIAAAFIPAAASAAPTRQQVDRALHKVKALKAEIASEQQQLVQLQARVATASEELLQAQDAFDQVTSQLLDVQTNLQAARQRYALITARLNERAREAYMGGTSSSLDFILGSSSLTDLSDRLEYIDVVAQSDVDLATQVQNTKDELANTAAQLATLQRQRRKVFLDKKAKEQALQANLDQQQTIVDKINSQLDQAKKYYDKVSKAYKKWLNSQTGVTWSNGLLKACPVGQPRAFGDGFGAPRYAGGFHLHAGVDIIAPLDTPIYAPFDGVAHSSYNTLGGNAVYVTGSQGYVYNAHLDHYSPLSNGPVHAGDVIGYVGNTGDAQGGVTHDHFEWHPNVIPSNWPKSAYGYSVIGDAVNPYPLLVDACN